MKGIALTAGLFLAFSGVALADGCGEAMDCHPMKPVVKHHVVRRAPVRAAYYDYASSGAVREGYGHSEWRVAPNDGQVPMMGDPCACAPAPMAYAPPPMMYGPPPGYYGEYAGIGVDQRGWTGGVGYMADGGGGGGGGFTDGFGQVHFAQGGNTENGPNYNSYGQSFQYNPSVAGPFVPQRMGVAAPVTAGSR